MSYMNNQESKNTTRFYPTNLKKFKSNDNSKYCICRSTWETKFCKWCDTNDQILYWASEPIAIPYFDKVKQKSRRYFPDFLVKVADKDTKRDRIYLIEVKPYKECIQPKITKGKSKKTILYEKVTWETNKSKWISANAYCKNKGWTFKIITEKELGI